MNERILGVIPARYASTRFPGKPLTMIKGKPMIQWVYEACQPAFEKLVVATDDKRILDAVENFNGIAVMTSDRHRSGTERCFEVMNSFMKEDNYHPDIVVNIQGDEPLIKKEQILELTGMFDNDKIRIATLIKQMGATENPSDPNTVKVVTDKENRALYFSRSPIPFRKEKTDKPFLKHIGMYAYRPETLKEIVMLPQSPLEISETLEQLRWIENGFEIFTRKTAHENIGIDTPKDLQKLLKLLENHS